MPFSRLFRSRWAALFWAAGIVWTAYDVAAEAPQPAGGPAQGNAAMAEGNTDTGTDAAGSPVDAADLAVLANVMGGQ